MRQHYRIYDLDERNPRYIVVWGLQWQVIDRQVIGPTSDLVAAMSAAIEHLGNQGWEAESDAAWGFTFVRKDRERRLLTLTPRDPHDQGFLSFSPFSPAT
jgi:hypothetical protein